MYKSATQHGYINILLPATKFTLINNDIFLCGKYNFVCVTLIYTFILAKDCGCIVILLLPFYYQQKLPMCNGSFTKTAIMNLTLSNRETTAISGRKQITTDLLNGTELAFSMVYDIDINTVRVESNGTRRVFMIYEEGVRQRHPHKVIKNEYGLDIGAIEEKSADMAGKGTIKFLETDFYYNRNFRNTKTLTVYRALEPQTSGTIHFLEDEMPDDYFNFILAGLCWYLQLPVKHADHITASIVQQKQAAIL